LTDRSAAEAGTRFDHVTTGRSRAAVKGVAWSTLSSIAPALFSMLVFAATSRVLERADFGLVAFAASIATIASTLGPVGFGEALIQRRVITERHTSSVFWLCVIFAVAVYVPLCLIAGPIAGWMHEPVLFGLILFLGLRVIFGLMGTVPNAILVRSMSFRQMALRTTIASFVAGAICLVLLMLGFGLWALATSQLAAAVVTSLGSYLATRWTPRLIFDRRALGELSAFGTFASGYRMLDILSLDQILIGTLVGPAALGIYSFSRRIYQILNDLIAGALGNASYSLLSSLQADRGKLRQAYLLASFTSSLLAFPVFAGIAMTAGQFIPIIFGHHWVAAVTCVQGFCALGLLASIGVLQSSLIRSQGMASLWFYYLAIKQVATLLYVVLFASWGVNALILALVIENYLLWPVPVLAVSRLLRMPVWRYLSTFLLPAVATLAMVGTVTLVKTEITGMRPLTGLAVTVAVGAVTYLVVIALFGRRHLGEIRALVLKRTLARA
jgi:O-antigen/teichoic acid export membrane protein